MDVPTPSSVGPRREYLLFFILNAIGLGISLTVLAIRTMSSVTSTLADNIAANVVGLVFATTFRFVGYRTWVFGAVTDPAVPPGPTEWVALVDHERPLDPLGLPPTTGPVATGRALGLAVSFRRPGSSRSGASGRVRNTANTVGCPCCSQATTVGFRQVTGDGKAQPGAGVTTDRSLEDPLRELGGTPGP